MARAQAVDPVKLFVAVLHATDQALEQARQALAQRWGPLDYEGPDRPFDATDYYAEEMGPQLLRRLVSFERVVAPETLPAAKLACNEIEDALAGSDGARRVNLDIGTLDHNKIVLASLKSAGQKIHIADGVYADLVARFKGGRYVPFEWTFPDFSDGRYDEDLAVMRRLYIAQRKAT